MKMRTQARYSVRMMTAIARLSSGNGPVGLGEVSRHCGISRRYLEQLVTPLRNARLVRSLSGRRGGYALSRSPDQIKLGDIITAAIGPIAITDCAVDPRTCISADFCNCQALWALVNLRINQVLNEYSLADLMDKNFQKKIKKEIQSLATQ
jgi:Rrf2 family cysteine metabolism transcriptional repressor